MNKRIYVAAPYTHEDDKVQEYRANEATKYTAELISEWNIAFSPLTHCRPLALYKELPHNYDFWKEFNINFLKNCDELHVLTLDGWDTSVGVTGEIMAAKLLGLKIVYIEA